MDTGLDTTMYPEYKPYLCKGNPHKDFTIENNPFYDTYMKHGTNITSIIVNQVSSNVVCIVVVKWITKSQKDNKSAIKNYMKALRHIKKIGVNILNMSLSGEAKIEGEQQYFNYFDSVNILTFVAAGNDRVNLDENCNTYPVCYPNKNFVRVGINNRSRYKESNYGRIIQFNINLYKPIGNPPLEGTSQATAWVLNQFLKDLIKHYGASR